MATLTSTLTLTSTAGDITTQALSLTESDTLSVVEPTISPSRVSISHSGATELLTVAGNTSDTYVYVKNTDSTNYVVLQTSAAATWGVVNPGESSFFTVQGERGLKLLANNAACIVEYGYWTKS